MITQNLRKLSDTELQAKIDFYEKAVDLALDLDTMWQMYDNFFEYSKEKLRRLTLKTTNKHYKIQCKLENDLIDQIKKDLA